MKKREIKGLMHDLLRYLDWRNPASRVFIGKKLEVDLLTKEVFCDEDDVFRFYHEKIDWFHLRLKQLNANLDYFSKAQIIVDSVKEKIDIVYKDEGYSDEIFFT